MQRQLASCHYEYLYTQAKPPHRGPILSETELDIKIVMEDLETKWIRNMFLYTTPFWKFFVEQSSQNLAERREPYVCY